MRRVSVTPPRYRQNAQRVSRAIQDTKRTPTEETADWIEYAIKHDGAKFNIIPTHGMPWWKLANVDVYAFLAAVGATAAYVLLLVLPRAVYRALCKPKPKKKQA